jgi:peroxiredoxin
VKIHGVLVLCLAVSFLGCSSPGEGRSITEFQLKAVDGSLYSLVIRDGLVQLSTDDQVTKPRALMVHFFQPNCQACHEAMKALEELHKEFSAKGVLVLGIAHRGDLKSVKPVIDRLKPSYLLLLGTGSEVALKLAGGDAIHIADGTGVFRFSQAGYGKGDEKVWKENIERLLKGQSDLGDITSRKALKVGDHMPAVKLVSLMTEKPIALTIEGGKLTFTDETGKTFRPKGAVGFFSRY